MNFSTTPRRLAQGLLALCLTLASVAKLSAQCSDFVSFPPGPVTINLTLDAGGDVQLSDAVLNANGFVKNAGCSFWLSTDPDPNNLAAYTNAPVNFTCNPPPASSYGGVGTYNFHLRVGGTPLISGNMGPGATVVDITVNVLDNIPPTVACPGNLTFNTGDDNPPNPADCATQIIDPGFFFSDNCLSVAASWTMTGATTLSGAGNSWIQFLQKGVTTITYKATDASAQTATCSFTITIVDNELPTITCPANVNTTTDPSNTCSRVVTGLTPTYSDNCAVTSLTWAASAPTSLSSPLSGINDVSGTTFQLGVTTVTYTASDGVNPSVNCAFTVTVTDNDLPTITCPANQTVNAAVSPSCVYTVSGTGFNATASDNCSLIAGQPVIVSTPGYNGLTTLNGATFNVGTTAVTWSATDAAANVKTCSFNVTVNDVTAPTVTLLPPGVVTFQAVFNVNTAPGSCSQNVTWYRPSPLTHSATDCSGVVTLTENATVSINCPGLNCVNDPNFFVTNGVTPYPYDATNFLHWVTPVSANFPVGTTVITYEFKDLYGNTTIQTVTVNVAETQPPVATCAPGPISVAIDPSLGVAVIPAGLINNGSTDNCGISSMTVTPAFFDCTAIPTNNTPANNVTLKVTDNAGNMATCVTNIFVYDNTLPIIGCPSSFSVSAGPSCSASVPSLIFNPAPTSSVGAQQFFDNAIDPCGLTFDYQVNGGGFVAYPGLITIQPVNLSALVFNAGLNTVTLRAKDGSNNIGACTFSVNVLDQTPPTFSGCPANITMNANTGGCGKIVSWTPPVFSDNCTIPLLPVSTYVTSSHTPGSFFSFGTTTVSYTAHDAAGNINNTCTFTVTINDTQAPVANCKNATVTVGPGGTVNMPASAIDNNSTDNCFYSYQTDPYTFNCSQVGTPQTVTLTIVDAGGLTASCTATVTVLDGQAPVALCNLIPATLNLSAGAPGTVTMNAAAVGNSTDNCPANVTYQISVDGSVFANSFVFNCSHIGPRMVTLKASDSAGSNTCGPVTVTIRDVSAPSFTVPAAIILDCNDSNPNLLLPSNTGSPTNIVDNCDGAPTVTSSDLTSNVVGCPNALNIVRTWTVTDHAVPPNSFSQTQNIQVRDITGPVWTLGTAFSANTTGGNVCSVPSPIPAVAAGTNVSDACGSLSVTYGIVFPAGSMPATVPVGTPLPLNGLLPQLFPIGVSTVTFVAIDECGNTAARTVTVTINDVNAPVFSYSRCNQTYTLPNTTNSCDQLYAWTRPVLADLFDCKTYSVTEAINNTSVQQFVNLVNPFGNWPPLNPNVVAQFPVGTTIITYTATDASNNVSTCTFNVVIQDTQAPTITCPMNQTLSITAGCTSITTIPNYTTLSTVTDNCPNNIIFTQTPPAGNLVSSVVPVVPGNTFSVTLKATDGQSLGLMSATCSFNVTLIDGQAPVPNVLALPNIVSFCGKDTVDAPASTDCNGVSFVTIYGTPSVPVLMTLPPLVPGGPPRYVINAGNYVITWSYTDAQNNTTTQPQNVSISVDLFPPTAICHADSVSLNGAGIASVFATSLDNGSFDQDGCGPVSLSFRVGNNAPYNYVPSLNFSCANLGVNAVVFAATDVNNNTATCATTIKVKDVIAPVIANVPANITVQACSPIPTQAVLTATDVCDTNVPVVPSQTSTQATTNESCGFYSYTITRNWTATDDSGNTKTETQTITVQDTQAPVFSSPDSIVVLTDPNRTTCNDTVFLNMLDYLADCAPDSELVVINTLNPSLGANITGIYALGSHVITFTATDKCGNAATKSIKLVVKDGTLPTAVCINGISVSLQSGGTVSIGVNQVNDHSFDNCGIATMLVQRMDPPTTPGNTISFSCPDADGTTQHPVRLIVTDNSGNQSTCQTYVVVQDNVPPTITCPANDTILCTAVMTPAALGTATATDNCPILPNAITFADSIGDGAGLVCDVLIRTWMARDLAGNLSTCNQLISIVDTIKPVLSAYTPDITISCSEPLPSPLIITATDNCSQNVNVTFEQDTIDIAQGVCGKYDYTILRTRTATDDCGNTETHVRHIKVVDNTPPGFPGMPATFPIQSANFPPTTNCTVPVSLNAADYFVDCALLSECTINSIVFQPALAITPVGLNVSGNYPVGTTKVIFSITDPCGNKGVDTIDVVVTDNSVPTMVCNDNVVIALGSNGNASIDPSDIDLGSTDNCAIDTLVLSKSTFDCADLGVNTIQLIATDIYGNTNFCAVNVNVTLGTNAGFSLTATGTSESFFGAGDGSVTAVTAGGSGSFSLTWSTADTISTVSPLPAGAYTVTVIDNNTGCVSVDTAVINAGPKITVNVGAGSGCQGQTVVVPVTIDNFINVSGFSFGLQLNTGVAGTILSLSDVNPAITGATLTANSIFWTSPGLTGVNLANGSLLFNLNVQLSNPPAPVGTTSVVSPSALPSLAFLQNILNVPTQAGMIVFNNGSVTITCTVADNEIAGDIHTWKAPVQPVPGVNVALTGTAMGADVTALPLADYSFLVPGGANTVTTPTKVATAKSTKINVGDLLFIQAHAAPPPVQIPFTSPYQWLAGDINGDKIVNIVDYALVQAYIVNNPPSDGHFHFNPAPPDWKFVPKAYVFPGVNPLNPTPPSTINHTNVVTGFPDDDFVGVLLGDVNGDVIPNATNNGGSDFNSTFKIRINERSLQTGEIVTIPFKASDFVDRQAYQMTIAFDQNKFELTAIEPGVLPDLSEANFGTAFLNDGLISTAWVGNKPHTLADNDVLFSLKFKVLGNVNKLSDVLHASSEIAEAIAVDFDGNTESIDFEFVTSVGTGEIESKSFALYQNQPNPFSAETTISFRLPEAGRAKLHIFGTDGRIVRTIIGDYPAGNNAVTIRKDEFGAPGVYWYELETLQHSDRKKMILMN